MGWPTDDLTSAHLDQTTDDPSQARAELLAAVQKIQAILAAYGVASGVCELDASAEVPLSKLKMGSGNGIDADTVDGIHAATTAAANKLLALDASGKLPADITGNAATASDADTVDGYHASDLLVTQPSSVGQNQLKTATGSFSYSPSYNNEVGFFILPGGEYGFFPKAWTSSASYTVGWGLYGDSVVRSMIKTDVGTYTGVTYYASQRYIQASPPYKIGDTTWGHFLYLLRNKSTGETVAAYEAQDPPWAYNGPMHLHKDDPELLAAVPHPFPEFGTEKFPETDFEVVIVDLRDMDVNLWMYDNLGKGKQSILEDLRNVAPIGKDKTFQEIGVPEIPGFTDLVKVRARA